MKKIFGIIPTGIVLLYAVGQFVAYSITGRMYFSDIFIWEFSAYILLSLLYISLAAYLDRDKYLRFTIYGAIIGLLLFVVVAVKLFLGFEFYRNLSI